MKIVGTIFIILVVLVAGLLFAKNMIAESVLVNGMRVMTGMELKIGSMEVGVLKPVLSVNDLKVYNPPNYTDKIMASVPEIYIQYDLKDILKGFAHSQEIRIHLEELIVEKNKQGDVNIKTLQTAIPKQQGGGKAPRFRIDTLNLKIGKVTYKDYSLATPTVKEFNINLDENFKNVTDPKALTSLILVKALSRTTIPSLANVDLGALKDNISGASIQQVGGVLGKVKEDVAETVVQTKGAMQKLFAPKQ